MTVAGASSRPPLIRRLVGFNLLTAVVFAAVGFLLGRWLGDRIGGASLGYVAETGESDVALALGYLLGVVGFLVGLGFANYPVGRLLGRPPLLPRPTEGVGRYFGFCPDHKVVAKQYFVGVGVFFAIAGLNAMLIRLELLSPGQSIWPPDTYLEVVSLHGSMMMGLMTSAVLGPLGNYLVPLLIGARRSAFPRIEALSFWLLMAAGVTLLSTVVLGGFQTGWTGYAPLSEQGVVGVLAYAFFFALVGLSMTLLGLNLVATVVTMRAPGMSWGLLAGGQPTAHLVLAGLALAATLVATAATFRGTRVPSGPWRDYVALTKPRIMSLLLVTGFFAMLAGERGLPPPATMVALVGGLGLACGGASALNHVLDRDIDPPDGEADRGPTGRVGTRAGLPCAGVRPGAHRLLVHPPRRPGEPARRRARPRRRPLLRAGLHPLVQALDAAEHRDRGAAGAMPPLVGWAAATGKLSP